MRVGDAVRSAWPREGSVARGHRAVGRVENLVGQLLHVRHHECAGGQVIHVVFFEYEEIVEPGLDAAPVEDYQEQFGEFVRVALIEHLRDPSSH